MKYIAHILLTSILALTACGQPAPTDKEPPKTVDPTIANSLPKIDPLAAVTQERDQLKLFATEQQKQIQLLQATSERNEMAVRLLQANAQLTEAVKQINDLNGKLDAANKRIAEFEAKEKEKK